MFKEHYIHNLRKHEAEGVLSSSEVRACTPPGGAWKQTGTGKQEANHLPCQVSYNMISDVLCYGARQQTGTGNLEANHLPCQVSYNMISDVFYFKYYGRSLGNNNLVMTNSVQTIMEGYFGCIVFMNE